MAFSPLRNEIIAKKGRGKLFVTDAYKIKKAPVSCKRFVLQEGFELISAV